MKKFFSNSGPSFLADLAIFAIVGVTPLFFNYFFSTSLDLSKIVFFKIFVLILLTAIVWRFVLLKFSINKNIWKKNWPVFSLVIFLILSLFFSVDYLTSWFGSYDRQEGLISWLFYGLWFALLISHLSIKIEADKIKTIDYFLKVISGSGLLVSLYAILQLLGIDFVSWSEPANLTGRAISSLGQPNYLACWLLLVLPFSAYLIFKAQSKTPRIFWSSVFLIEIFALLSTGSRAAFLIFVVISILWLVWFLSKKHILSAKKIWLIALLGLFLSVMFIGILAFFNQPRLLEFTDLKKGSAYVRLEIWQHGWQAFLKKPVFGYGLENQKEAYVSYYQISDAIYSNPNTYTDRAHNLVLDILLTSGLLGLLFFSLFIYWVFANLFNALKSESYKNLAAFLIWSLTLYLISILFNFSVTITNIYFWLIVALSVVIGQKNFFIIKSQQQKYQLKSIIIFAGVILVMFYGINLEINRLKADYYYKNVLLEISRNEYFTALVLKDYLTATAPDKVSDNYYNRVISLSLLEKLPTISDRSSLFVVLRYLADTEKTLTPNNFENKFVRAFIFGAISNRIQSEQFFKELIAVSPQMPKLYLAWGDVLMFNHDYQQAVIKFEYTLNLLPNLDNKYLSPERLFSLNIYRDYVTGRLEKAKSLLK